MFIAPVIAGLCALNIYPFFKCIALAFTERDTAVFTAQNFVTLFTQDRYFWQSTANTLYFAVLTVPVGVFIALILAVLLNRQIRCRGIYRAVFFLPMVCAPSAIAMVWRWCVFNSNSGFINYTLGLVGIQGPKWLSDPNVVMVSVAIISVWKNVGYDMVLLLAGLQFIPKTYYEAASLDGATPLQQFRHITVPMISPALFFVIIMRTMNAVRQFDLSFMIAHDRQPGFRNVQTLLYQFYRETFIKLNANYGASIVLWTVMIVLLITAFQFFMEKRWVNYDA